MNRETILKIYSDLIADNQEKRAYIDGVLRGLQLMRDNLLIRIDKETSTLENPIKAESLAAGTIQVTGKIFSGSTKIKVFDRALKAEEVKEVMKNDSDDQP